MTEMGHIAYQSICLAETSVLTPIPRLYLFLIKSYWQMTVGELGLPQKGIFAHRSHESRIFGISALKAIVLKNKTKFFSTCKWSIVLYDMIPPK